MLCKKEINVRRPLKLDLCLEAESAMRPHQYGAGLTVRCEWRLSIGLKARRIWRGRGEATVQYEKILMIGETSIAVRFLVQSPR